VASDLAMACTEYSFNEDGLFEYNIASLNDTLRREGGRQRQTEG